MAYQDDTGKFTETSIPPRALSTPNPITSMSQNSPTFQQLLQGEATSWPQNSSSHNKLDDVVHQPKKSVLAKVREKAKKLRYSLSGKKRHDESELQGPNATPAWGVTLEDEEEDEKDAEYLGAPMYESEMAPDNYKAAAKQQPREVNYAVPAEKNIVVTSTGINNNQPTTHKTTIGINDQPSDKLATPKMHAQINPAGSKISTHEGTTKGTTTFDVVQHSGDRGDGHTHENTKTSSSPQTWDKGVSVKEYLMHKFEPGEDERALSQVITESLSPKSTSMKELGVLDKMREAVNSLLWYQRTSSDHTNKTTSTTPSPSANMAPISSSTANQSNPILISTTKRIASSHIDNTTNINPVATNHHQVVEEENQGRILQAN